MAMDFIQRETQTQKNSSAIETIQNDVINLTSSVGTLQADVANNTSSIETLQEDIENNTSSIEILQEDVSLLSSTGVNVVDNMIEYKKTNNFLPFKVYMSEPITLEGGEAVVHNLLNPIHGAYIGNIYGVTMTFPNRGMNPGFFPFCTVNAIVISDDFLKITIINHSDVPINLDGVVLLIQKITDYDVFLGGEDIQFTISYIRKCPYPNGHIVGIFSLPPTFTGGAGTSSYTTYPTLPQQSAFYPYVFGGWYRESAEIVYNNGDRCFIQNTNEVLQPILIDTFNNKIKITYMTDDTEDGGAVPQPQYFDGGQFVYGVPAPENLLVLRGHHIDEWATLDRSIIYKANKRFFAPHFDITLYPVWKRNI